MYNATVSLNFPDDELSRLLQWLVRSTGLLEPHDHDGLHASSSEVFALGELSEAGVLTQQALAERLGLEKSTVSRLAASLEKRGWLARERDPANRRFYQLTLTAAGRQAAQHIGEHLRSRHHHLMACLTAEERKGLMVGLTGLIRAFNTPT